MPSLREFSKRITLRGGLVATRADRLTRQVALAADQAVVVGTPVDTGRARSNWIAQIGSRAPSAIEPYAPGELGSTKAQNTQAALDQAEGVIRGYMGGKGLAIYISNNVPYIQKLNDGSSAQAPANFVETAVMQAVAVISRGKLLTD